MKRIVILAAALAFPFVLAGCETWAGVKKDTKKGWDSTKEAVHDATK